MTKTSVNKRLKAIIGNEKYKRSSYESCYQKQENIKPLIVDVFDVSSDTVIKNERTKSLLSIGDMPNA